MWDHIIIFLQRPLRRRAGGRVGRVNSLQEMASYEDQCSEQRGGTMYVGATAIATQIIYIGTCYFPCDASQHVMHTGTEEGMEEE